MHDDWHELHQIDFQQLPQRVKTMMNMTQMTWDTEFDAELGALKFKSKRKIGGPSVCAKLLIMYIACIHSYSSRRPLQRFYIQRKVRRAVVGYYGLHNLSRSRLEIKITSLLVCDYAYVFRNPDEVSVLVLLLAALAF